MPERKRENPGKPGAVERVNPRAADPKETVSGTDGDKNSMISKLETVEDIFPMYTAYLQEMSQH